MADRAGPLRSRARVGSALALVLIALIAVDAPAGAQAIAGDGQGEPLIAVADAKAGTDAVLPPPAPEISPIGVAAAVSPEAAVVPPAILAAFEPPQADAEMPGQETVADPVPLPDEATPGDPLEGTNRDLFKVQNSLDRRFFRPVAKAYQRGVPKPVRSGLRNIIRNLTEPIVFLNDLLQLRPGRALRTLGRFAINSTVGLGGAIDVGKKLDLPYRSNSFGTTLGRWGVGPGPYLYLPLIGPTTLRDLLGGPIDGLVLPVGVGFPFDRLDYQLSSTGVATIDKRAEAEADLEALMAGAADPYATLRSVYLQSREAAIADARGTPLELAPLDDPLAGPADQGKDAGAPADAPATDAVPAAVPDAADGAGDPAGPAPAEPPAPQPAPMLVGAAPGR